ncbi:MAG: hypothetical protein GC131_09555 [Alphaproteobacteria bacterium]|nr:hypothetical protein [Alphaproteobacteria bacterium]
MMNAEFERWFGREHLDEYCTGVFSDCMDKMGLSGRVTHEWKINNPRGRLFGKVRTLTVEALDTKDEQIQLGLNFLASLGSSDVFVVKGNRSFAYFGELMSRLSQEIGLAGVVIDGLTRDTWYTQTIELPVFAKGYSPVDIKGRGRVTSPDVAVVIDGITVQPGDYVFADQDAVVFIPSSRMEDVAKAVRIMVGKEADIKTMIENGKSIKDILTSHTEF